jgi:hypothetical protein
MLQWKLEGATSADTAHNMQTTFVKDVDKPDSWLPDEPDETGRSG